MVAFRNANNDEERSIVREFLEARVRCHTSGKLTPQYFGKHLVESFTVKPQATLISGRVRFMKPETPWDLLEPRTWHRLERLDETYIGLCEDDWRFFLVELDHCWPPALMVTQDLTLRTWVDAMAAVGT